MSDAALIASTSVLVFAALAVIGWRQRHHRPEPEQPASEATPPQPAGPPVAPAATAQLADHAQDLTPPPDPAVALYRLALVKEAHADVVYLPNGETERITMNAAIQALDENQHAEALWRAAIAEIRQQRRDQAQATGTTEAVLAERGIATAEIAVELAHYDGPTADAS